MVVTYNLISCNEEAYPSQYNIYDTRFLGLDGTYQRILPEDRVYFIEKITQAFVPAPEILNESDSISIEFLDVVVDGVALTIPTPLQLYTAITETTVAFPSTYVNPPTYPTHYTAGLANNIVKIAGFSQSDDLGTLLQNILTYNSVIKVTVDTAKASSMSVPPVFTTYKNCICISRPTTVSTYLRYRIIRYIGLTVITDSVREVTLTGSTISYKENGSEVLLPNPMQAFFTDEKSVRADVYNFDSLQAELDCPCEDCEFCFKLVNCTTEDTLTTSTDLAENLNKIVTLEGYEGCWKVEMCDAAVPVVITDSYASCKACLPNCNEPTC